ncbi:hypothetical protein [Streptomyces sp. NPDC086787]|uniref:hypothetical protein n=1 Tax=Streptomyces sp. NPDC086787 TaxID=3365759 RepID=UPI00381FBA18
MARPADWVPLAEADPVPGDPEGIRGEVEHMKKVAEKLRTQAAAMQAIADCDGLNGKYADDLGDKARGLTRRLDLAEDRYREVKGHLHGWADDMETAQKEADRALGDAKVAQRIIDTHKPDGAAKSAGKDSGEESGKDEPDDDLAVKRAKEDLEAARAKLNSAVSFYGERADHYASKIRSSIDDDMKDSWWNDFKAWVTDAEWLSTLADRLSDICTVLTFVAIFFPAVGGLAAVLTGVIFAIHLARALAGNGSWFDVLTDIAAFKMAKNGVKAAKAVKRLQREARSVAQGITKQAEKRAATRASAPRRAAVGGKAGRLHRAADAQKARSAARQVEKKPLPEVRQTEKARALGDKDMAQQMKDIRRLRNEYPDSRQLKATASEAERQLGVSRANWGASTALDLGGRLGDATSSTYTNAKGHMTGAGTVAMVRFKPVKREASSPDSARARKARRVQGRARSSGPHHPHLSNRNPQEQQAICPPATVAANRGAPDREEAERLFKLAARLRYALLAVAVVMLIWFLVSLSGEKTWGVELATPTWPLDLAALTPLVALVRFRNPKDREEGVTLESDLRILSGLYLFMALSFALLDGQWQLWPAVAFSSFVYAGIWYTNKQAHSGG